MALINHISTDYYTRRKQEAALTKGLTAKHGKDDKPDTLQKIQSRLATIKQLDEQMSSQDKPIYIEDHKKSINEMNLDELLAREKKFLEWYETTTHPEKEVKKHIYTNYIKPRILELQEEEEQIRLVQETLMQKRRLSVDELHKQVYGPKV